MMVAAGVSPRSESRSSILYPIDREFHTPSQRLSFQLFPFHPEIEIAFEIEIDQQVSDELSSRHTESQSTVYLLSAPNTLSASSEL